MKFFSLIRPRYIVALTIVVALLMFGSAFLELRQSRSELFHVLQEHAFSLAETIGQSSANVVLSTEQIEEQLSERLLNNAYYIARLDSLGLLRANDLKAFAAANRIYRINIFNRSGERVLGSFEPLPHSTALKENVSPREVLKPILRGTASTLVIGLKQARFEEGQRYAIAIRRTRPGGGAIVLNLDAAKLLEFRKRIGIGKLIRDLGDNTGIEYVAIQDREGVLAATNGVRELSSIDHDSTLARVLDRDSTIARQVEFNGRETFEVVRHLAIEGASVGVLRIGFSMDEIRSTEARMTRRMLVMTIVLVVIGVLVFTAIVVNQNYSLMAGKYSQMRSLTGEILLTMRDAVVTVDSENRITMFNRQAEELFDRPARDVAGKTSTELEAGLAACLSRIFAAEEAEFSLECSPGTPRIVSVSLSKTADSHGMVQSRTAVIKDLTESRRMEEEIKRNEKLTAMGALASGVAHEIRNPLNAIAMIAQRYEREFTPRKGLPEYRTLTGVLKKESERVNAIIQQFLSFARPPKLNREDVPVGEFVRHIGTLFSAQAKGKGIRFDVASNTEGRMNVDSAQMTQALLNLLQNALDATSRRGVIGFTVDRRGEEIHFTVKDTGTGIPHDTLGKIFDLYFTTKSKGTGMGLAIAHQIVVQHRGHIDVVSEVGKGSTFSVSIPAA